MNMKPTTYFRLTLLFPIVLPLLIYLVDSKSWLFGVLFFSLAFGGPAYIIFAILMFIWFGKLSTSTELRKLTLKGPILFIPIQATTWIVYFYYGKLSNPELTGGWSMLLPFAVYILILGYAYVLIADIGYSLFNKLGLINGASSLIN